MFVCTVTFFMVRGMKLTIHNIHHLISDALATGQEFVYYNHNIHMFVYQRGDDVTVEATIYGTNYQVINFSGDFTYIYADKIYTYIISRLRKLVADINVITGDGVDLAIDVDHVG